jgi:hypothetical protein
LSPHIIHYPLSHRLLQPAAQPFRIIQMACSCHNEVRYHPCGHRSYNNRRYCSTARARGNIFCRGHSVTQVHGTQARCSTRDCQLRRVWNRWRCCTCGQGPNTTWQCLMAVCQIIR